PHYSIRERPPTLTYTLSLHDALPISGAHVMVMGDMVVLEDQANPVMSAALDNGLEVTALHNHFFWDSPKVMFMHIGGMGDEATLDRKSTRLNSSHSQNSYAVFCLKKK